MILLGTYYRTTGCNYTDTLEVELNRSSPHKSNEIQYIAGTRLIIACKREQAVLSDLYVNG